MKTPFRLLLFLALPSSLHPAAPADELAAVRAADAQRLEATIAGDSRALGELLSDELRYAYSEGRVQTKAQFLASVAANRIKYLSITPRDVELQPVAAGVVVEHGRVVFAALTSSGRSEFTLRFLAVWRLENGRWRLFAYQSSQLAPAK